MAFLPGEQGLHFKINLYDHGSGVCVADVDGNGADDVYLVNQLGPNALYLNDGHGRFTDVTAGAGVALGDRICVGAAFGDLDGDGDQDLYVTSVRGGNVLFRNDGGTGGNLRFTDVTADAGLTLVAHSWAPTMFDADGDGDLDLFVTNTAEWTTAKRDTTDRYFEGKASLFDLVDSPVEHDRFYRNDGRLRFTDVTAAAGLSGPGWDGDTAVFDYDVDGDLDLFVANMFGKSALHRNDGACKFTDVTHDVLGATSWGAAASKVLDIDGDGRLDLLVTDMHSDMWMPIDMPLASIDQRRKFAGPEGDAVETGRTSVEQAADLKRKLNAPATGAIYGSTLFHALGGGRFEEISDKAGAETLWPWGIGAADFDLDGDEDVFLASGMGFPYPYIHSPFLVNQGDGTFVDRCNELGTEPPPGGRLLDTSIGQFDAPRSSRAVAVADFDADGRPDMVVNNFNDRAFLWMNRLPARHWAAFRLKSACGAAEAIGATVTLRAGGKTMVRMVQAAGGYLGQDSRTLHFGLGDATKIDSCEIRWPCGKVRSLEAPAIDSVQNVTEPVE